MLVIGLILSMFGIGLFCWLIFTLAVCALPFFVGLTAGMAAFHGDAGVIGALLVGVVAGALTLGVGQIASRSSARCLCAPPSRPPSPFPRRLPAIMRLSNSRRSASRRSSGARCSPGSARSSSAARLGRG
jgi:hypothetical protein